MRTDLRCPLCGATLIPSHNDEAPGNNGLVFYDHHVDGEDPNCPYMFIETDEDAWFRIILMEDRVKALVAERATVICWKFANNIAFPEGMLDGSQEKSQRLQFERDAELGRKLREIIRGEYQEIQDCGYFLPPASYIRSLYERVIMLYEEDGINDKETD